MKQITLIIAMFIFGNTFSQVDIKELVKYADSITTSEVSIPKVPGVVLGIASSDSIFLLKGYGYGDYDKKIAVDPKKTLFQIGSVGKLFTSIGLLQQIEKEKISLNDNVNQYLNNWKIRNSFNKPVTPFQLLTHTAGFNDRFLNYMAKSNSEVESLGKHLPKNMPSVFQSPGTEINYSNYSYALTGHLIEQVSGKSFEEYIQSNIFNTLKLSSATYDIPNDYLKKGLYANGYSIRDTSFVVAKMFPRHAKPAGSIAATGKDMLLFAQALLKRDTTLLKDETYDLLLKEQFTNHRKLTGYTLGMEVQNYNGHIAYAKGGQVTGFLSVLIVFPDLDLTLFISTNTHLESQFDNILHGIISRFFPKKKASPVTVDFDIKEYVGKYANKRANHENVEELFQLYSGQFAIYESKTGNLMAYHDDKRNEYQYLGDDVFQNLTDSNVYIVFNRENGKITSMYRNVNMMGAEIPTSYRKLNWFERPRFMNDEYPYVLLFLISYLLLPVFWIGRFFIRKKKPEFLKKQHIPFSYHAVAFLFLGLFFWNVKGFIIPLMKLRGGMAFGFPEALANMRYFNWALAMCALILIGLSINLWVRKKSTVLFKVYFTLFSLVALSYILILHRWHFLNVTL